MDFVNCVTTMSMNKPSGAIWAVISVDYSSLTAGIGMNGFVAVNSGGSPWQVNAGRESGIATGGPNGGTTGVYNNLSSSGVWNSGQSAFWPATVVVSTSLCTLNLTTVNNVSGSGSFSIVPEPSANALASIALGVLAVLARRRKARLV